MKNEELFALLRRRGILWPAAEIYGSLAGLYDYGPAGHALKRNLETAWESWFLGLSDDYYRIEPGEFLPEAAVRASGHLEGFTDAEISCAHCHSSFRADTVLEKARPEGVDGLSPEQIGAIVREAKVRCPTCGSAELSVPRPLQLMFGVEWGPTGRERAYLQPETAQASYLAFSRMWEVGRRTLPLGIGVIARAYRNEIAPRQVLFRTRAFTQAELQIFFDPERFAPPLSSLDTEELPVLRFAERESGSASPTVRRVRDLAAQGDLPGFYLFHLAHYYRFLRDVLRIPADRLRLLEKGPAERAFYNRIQFDFEVDTESLGGFREVGAVHYRGDYDLTRHAQGSGRDLAVSLGEGRRVLPHVLELTFGIDRGIWALADAGVRKDGDRTSRRRRWRCSRSSRSRTRRSRTRSGSSSGARASRPRTTTPDRSGAGTRGWTSSGPRSASRSMARAWGRTNRPPKR
jgi:glycyl-tRNA synthetase